MGERTPGDKRRVLITGASSGLGLEMAVQLGRKGARVAITGRREAKLAAGARAVEAAGGECLPLLGSVADREAVKRHYALIRERWGGLDWAILNAGVDESMNARSFNAGNYHWTFATNVGGVVNWMEAILPDMIAAGSGTVAGIASLAAWRGLPNSGAYCASKAAVVSLLESTRVDLMGTGVKVVTVCPGYVKSEITDRNRPEDMPFLLETEDGARRVLEAVEKGRRFVHFPRPFSTAMIYGVHNLPGFLYDWLITKVVKRRPKRPYVDESKLSRDQSL
jgi:NADP-dependent 3-hydroxy acid dehydrogenase YdfG